MDKKNISVLIKALYKIDFFSNLNAAEIDVILNKFEKVNFPKNKKLVRAGKEGNFFAVISKGRVSIFKKKKFWGLKKITSLHPGDYFGEISLISDVPAIATVKTDSESEILMLMKTDFKTILKTNPALAEKIKHSAEKRKLESSYK